jgi:hypothetical protein
VWLETLVLIEAAAAFWLASLNVLWLTKVARSARGPARRAGAMALACVCGGHAMEALAFLWLGDTTGRGWPAVALVIVRTALTASMGLISLLLARAQILRRW